MTADSNESAEIRGLEIGTDEGGAVLGRVATPIKTHSEGGHRVTEVIDDLSERQEVHVETKAQGKTKRHVFYLEDHTGDTGSASR